MYCPKCGKDVEDSKFCPECGTAVSETVVVPVKETAGNDCVKVNKIAYALLAIFLGSLGIHRFYARRPVSGVMYILMVIFGTVFGPKTSESYRLHVLRVSCFIYSI